MTAPENYDTYWQHHGDTAPRDYDILPRECVRNISDAADDRTRVTQPRRCDIQLQDHTTNRSVEPLIAAT